VTTSLSLPVEVVTHSTRLVIAVQDMATSPAIALDTESNSFYHYPEQLCLIQIATCHKVYVIDTISLQDLTALKEILADSSVQKVVHGADYDIRSLDRHSGIRIRNLYDTSIAARFAGITQFGLAALLHDLLGVAIAKSKRLQRADWGRRPLSAEALHYAAADVRHLFTLRETLDQQLQALGRTAWVAEECARLEEVRYAEPDLETAYLSIKGAAALDGRPLAILKSLVAFREQAARRWGRPPFFVLPDNALVFLSTNPSAPFSDVPGLGETGLQRWRKGLEQALRNGLAAPPIHRLPLVAVEHFSRKQIQLILRRLDLLKEWRAAFSTALSLDPSLVWPTPSLERLARTPESLDVELASGVIRRWQGDNFASSLRSRVKSLP
jgi:ribonuclease D